MTCGTDERFWLILSFGDTCVVTRVPEHKMLPRVLARLLRVTRFVARGLALVAQVTVHTPVAAMEAPPYPLQLWRLADDALGHQVARAPLTASDAPLLTSAPHLALPLQDALILSTSPLLGRVGTAYTSAPIIASASYFLSGRPEKYPPV